MMLKRKMIIKDVYIIILCSEQFSPIHYIPRKLQNSGQLQNGELFVYSHFHLLFFQNWHGWGWWLITLHSNITWLTLTHSLDGSGGKIKTLTLYSDPNITSTAGCPFWKISKFECRVIKHARMVGLDIRCTADARFTRE